MNNASPKPRLLFVFPKPAERDELSINKGEAPSERLYGYCELRETGFSVCYSKYYKNSFTQKLALKLRSYSIIVPTLSSIMNCFKCDIIIIKDNLQILLPLIAKLFGKKVIFFDSLFQLPESQIKKIINNLIIQIADRVVCFSRPQIVEWSKIFPVMRSKSEYLPYFIDIKFYNSPTSIRSGTKNPDAPLLAVGRDPGRNFSVLEKLATEGIPLTLISPGYLLNKALFSNPNVTVLENISYSKLFEEYSGCLASIIPLNSGIIYPSGIRALMEAICLCVPVICDKTNVLADYFSDEEVFFCDTTDITALMQIISVIRTQPELVAVKINKARQKLNKYNISEVCDELSNIIMSVAR